MKNKKSNPRWRTIDKWTERKIAKTYGKRPYHRHGRKNGIKLKQERIRNKKLCKKYPWLVPRNVWTDKISWVSRPYDHIELDAMDNGWRKAFGDIWCEEMQKALEATNFVTSFRINQMKEKYGQLRVYHNNYAKPIAHVTNAFEVISEHICIKCGALDAHIVNNYGWFLPLCKRCYNLPSRISKLDRIPYEVRLQDAGYTGDEKIPTSYTMTTWSNGNEKTETYDISEIVTKIRWKNRKRKVNE